MLTANVFAKEYPLSIVQLKKDLPLIVLSRVTRIGLGASLLGMMVTCAPPVQTLNPVTLQPDARRSAVSDRLTEALPTREPTKPDAVEKAVPTTSLEQSEPLTVEDPIIGDTSADSVPPKTQVISGESKDEKPNLVEIARQEQLRRETIPTSRLRIDDKNLKRHATADMTSASPATKTGLETGAQTSAEIEEGDDSSQQDAVETAESERHWRELVRGLRYDWQDLVFEADSLEQEVERLRKEYYHEDDAYYRDGEIKPEWDASWESLQATRRAIKEAVLKLDRAIEEGRRAGALPGWLREGIELEPIDSSTGSLDNDHQNRFGVADSVEPTEASEAVEIEQ